MKSQEVSVTHLAIGKLSLVTHHVVAMDKVAEQNSVTKYSKCNTFKVISYLVLIS